MLLKVYIVSSIIIFALSYIILEIKIATLPVKLRRAIGTRQFDVGLVVKCFIPIINLFVLIGAITWTKDNLFR